MYYSLPISAFFSPHLFAITPLGFPFRHFFQYRRQAYCARPAAVFYGRHLGEELFDSIFGAQPCPDCGGTHQRRPHCATVRGPRRRLVPLPLPVGGISRRPNDFEMSRGSRRRRPARRRRSRRFPETVAERGRLLERCSRPHSGRLSVLRRRLDELICSSLCPAAGHGIAFERRRAGGDVSVSPSRLVFQSCMKQSLVNIRRVACRDDMPRIS